MAPNNNFVSVAWATAAAGVALTGERVNNSVIRHKELAYKNNSLLLEREKLIHKKELDYAESRVRRADQMAKIYSACSEKRISVEERDKCIELLSYHMQKNNLKKKLKNEKIQTENTTQNSPGFGSITFGNTIKAPTNKRYITEMSESEFFLNPKYEIIGDYPFSYVIFTSLFFGIPFGLAAHRLLISLYIWFVSWIRNYTSKK